MVGNQFSYLSSLCLLVATVCYSALKKYLFLKEFGPPLFSYDDIGLFTSLVVLLHKLKCFTIIPLHPAACAQSARSTKHLLLCLPPIQIPSLFTIFPPLSPLSLRCDVTQGEWVRCNVHIQKMCHYPVFGLKEGTLYQFRVRAVNKAGAGRPSKATEPVLTADPLEHTRTMGNSEKIKKIM